MHRYRFIVIFGTSSGLLNIFFWYASAELLQRFDFSFRQQEYLGYLALLLSLALVFFGIRMEREKNMGGQISFKKAFSVGFMIVLTASIVYVIGWEIYYPQHKELFMEQFQSQLHSDQLQENLSQEQLAVREKDFQKWMEYYQNPFIRVGVTFMEIFPIGLLVSLLSALVLKTRKSKS